MRTVKTDQNGRMPRLICVFAVILLVLSCRRLYHLNKGKAISRLFIVICEPEEAVYFQLDLSALQDKVCNTNSTDV